MGRPGNLKLSKPQPPQEKPTTYSPSYQPPVPGEDSNLPATGRAGLPPFQVLLQWLEYYHTQTGSWPEPEINRNTATVTESAAASTAPCGVEKPFLTLVPDLTPTKTSQITPASSSGKNITHKFNTSHHEKNEQENLSFKEATCYDLPASVYYRAALELIQKQADNAPVNSSLNTRGEIVLTFASFLAWCHHPSFRTAYDTPEAGMGMYLPLDQWSRILKMRKATLGECLKELEAAGLVEIHEAGKTADKSSNRKGTRSYHLAKPLPRPLPVFEVFQVENIAEPQEKSLEPEVSEFPSPGTLPEDKAEPLAMSHVDNYKNKKINNLKNHELGGRVGPGTFEEKFEFLVQVASFPGYTSPDSLITLDKREALKFASEPKLDITTIKGIYHQTLTAWSSGKCTKNPIGFFHHSLTRHLSQNTLEHTRAEVFTASTLTGNTTGTVVPQIISSRFQKPGLHNKDARNDYKVSKAVQPPVSGKKHFESKEEFKSDLENENTNIIQELDMLEVEHKLQKQVLEALQNRFKQDYLAEMLSQLQWEITLSADSLRLELSNPGSKFLAMATLGQSELSLLKIALSQSLRTLTGKSFEVEIAVA